MKYVVNIYETLGKAVIVDADNKDEAIDKVIENFDLATCVGYDGSYEVEYDSFPLEEDERFMSHPQLEDYMEDDE